MRKGFLFAASSTVNEPPSVCRKHTVYIFYSKAIDKIQEGSAGNIGRHLNQYCFSYPSIPRNQYRCDSLHHLPLPSYLPPLPPHLSSMPRIARVLSVIASAAWLSVHLRANDAPLPILSDPKQITYRCDSSHLSPLPPHLSSIPRRLPRPQRHSERSVAICHCKSK